jgi:hypothetical protein
MLEPHRGLSTNKYRGLRRSGSMTRADYGGGGGNVRILYSISGVLGNLQKGVLKIHISWVIESIEAVARRCYGEGLHERLCSHRGCLYITGAEGTVKVKDQ